MKWNTALYDNKHAFVAKYGEDVLGWLAPQRGEKILDIGCGTGTLTEKITESGASVTGIDASKEMIAKAKDTYKHIEFFVKDATDFSFDKKFNAAFSNATFHWIKDQQKALKCIYDVLADEGRFVYEMGAEHNIENIHHAVKKVLLKEGFTDNATTVVNYFSSAASQSVMLENVGFIVSNVIRFERPTELIGEDGMKNWIIQFCQSFFKNIPHDKAENIINEATDILRTTNYSEGKWFADYVRLRIKAIKKL